MDVQSWMMRQEHTFIHILIVRTGCDHSFGDKLLKIKWQHIQVTQHPDTNTMFFQIIPTGQSRTAFRGEEEKQEKRD